MATINWNDDVAAMAVSLPCSDIPLATLGADELSRLHALIVDLRSDALFMTAPLVSRFQELLPLVELQLGRLSA